MIGQYQPNEAGARTLAEARPLHVGHDLVTASVYDVGEGPCLAIFVGLKLVFEEPLPAEITRPGDVNPFIQRFIAGYEA